MTNITNTTTISISNGFTLANPSGYYVFNNGGDHLGTVCAEHDDTVTSDRGLDFEPLGYWVELDNPIHCDYCEALIVTRLTREGVEYVVEALDYPTGRPNVLAAWKRGFADQLEEREDTRPHNRD